MALTANMFVFNANFGDLRMTSNHPECVLDYATTPYLKSEETGAAMTGISCVECYDNGRKIYLHFDMTNWVWSMNEEFTICFTDAFSTEACINSFPIS